MDLFSKSYSIPAEQIDQKITQILKIESKNLDKKLIYRKLLGFIDLTTLEGSDNEKRIDQLCEQALGFYSKEKEIPNVAAVCVYPPFIAQAKEKLLNTSLKVASVAGAFPSGQSPISVKLAEIKYAIEQGADEIDMVISRGKFLEGNYKEVYDEIRAIKRFCGDVHLKVILETGELGSLENIKRASDIAISAGADFIKTSTGKIQPAATLEAFIVMLDAIMEYYEHTGKKIGIKPAGGISTPEQAIPYYLLLKNVLGATWLNPELFRIGASRLATKLLDLIND